MHPVQSTSLVVDRVGQASQVETVLKVPAWRRSWLDCAGVASRLSMQARRFFQGGERPEPRQRGTKRPPTEAESDDGGRSCTDGLDALWPEGTQRSQPSLQGNLKMQELGGVRGRYLPQASLQPHEHAIVVTIGRIII